MEHKMRLYDQPFQLMLAGTKTVEIRLNDEKRQAVQNGDIIVFTNLENADQSFKVEVLERVQFDSFQELLKYYDNEEIGASEDYQLSQKLADIYQIYSQAEELEYGAVSFRVKRI